MANVTADGKATSKSSVKKWMITSVGILLLVVALGYLLLNFTPVGAQWRMEWYLEEKYGEDFIVGKPERKSSGLGVEGVLSSVAQPVKNSNLSFKVLSDSSGVFDYYPSAIWSQAEQSNINRALNTYLNNGISMEVVINADRQILDNIRVPVPTYDQALGEYASKMSYTIRAERAKDNGDEIDDLDERFMQDMVSYINDKEIGYKSVQYTIRVPNSTQILRCNLAANHKKLDMPTRQMLTGDCLHSYTEGTL